MNTFNLPLDRHFDEFLRHKSREQEQETDRVIPTPRIPPVPMPTPRNPKDMKKQLIFAKMLRDES